ncbi:hypothetical protein I4U23_018739 [Adineta vaga]|nr:hypothetical protein I4U23_018739 [Adineta vaga]
MFIFYLVHVFIGLRRRKSWKITTRIIAIIFIFLFLPILAVSTSAVFWELKLIGIFGKYYISNSYQSTPNGFRKAQTGAACAAAILGLLCACLLLIDIICRLLTIGSVQKRQRRRKRRVNVIS